MLWSDLTNVDPAEALATRVSLMLALTLHVSCGRHTTILPLSLLAERVPTGVRLGVALERMRCRRCGARPCWAALADGPHLTTDGMQGARPARAVVLIDDPASDTTRYAARPQPLILDP